MKNDNKNRTLFNLFEKTRDTIVNAVDQNNDGELHLDDVTHLADNISSAAKEKATQIGSNLELKRQEVSRHFFQPIFEEDVKAEDFTLSDLIRVAEPNTLHLWSKVCEGAIGNLFKMNNIMVVNIYPAALDLFGITLFPNNKGDVYYVDPCDNRRYIALDEYFKVLKTARINELQKLAQDLGAKHFKVTYMEQKKSSSSRKTSIAGKFDIKNLGNLPKMGSSLERDHISTEYEEMEIAAELYCAGHDPVEPKLVYFKNDSSIQNLISMRKSDNTIHHHSLMLNFSNSSGIKTRQAAKIDIALKMMNCKRNISVQSEAESEERKMFRYEIDF